MRRWMLVCGLSAVVAGAALGAAVDLDRMRASWWTTAAEQPLDDVGRAALAACDPTIAVPAFVQDLDWPCGEPALSDALVAAVGDPDRRAWASGWCTDSDRWSRRCLRWAAVAATRGDRERVDQLLVGGGAPPAGSRTLIRELGLADRLGPDGMPTDDQDELDDTEWATILDRVADLPEDRDSWVAAAADHLLTGGALHSDLLTTARERARRSCAHREEFCAPRLAHLARLLTDTEPPVHAPPDVFASEPWLDALHTAFGPERARAAAHRLHAWRAWREEAPAQRHAIAVARLWPGSPAASDAALRGEALDADGLGELAKAAAIAARPFSARAILRMQADNPSRGTIPIH